MKITKDNTSATVNLLGNAHKQFKSKRGSIDNQSIFSGNGHDLNG